MWNEIVSVNYFSALIIVYVKNLNLECNLVFYINFLHKNKKCHLVTLKNKANKTASDHFYSDCLIRSNVYLNVSQIVKRKMASLSTDSVFRIVFFEKHQKKNIILNEICNYRFPLHVLRHATEISLTKLK